MSLIQTATRGAVASTFGAPERTPTDVLASVRIEAELRRILYALATPEYMEAWLQMPNAERVECHSEQRSFDRFRIDLLSAGRKEQSIYGSCLLSKPNRVTYLWEKEHRSALSRSMVEILIFGGSTFCSLKLKHRGLVGEDERDWHSLMWSRSLVKLRILMEGIGFESAY
jgi:uncharacterized protein YndB with AHSA1/START domain